jgi:hypothetical protein
VAEETGYNWARLYDTPQQRPDVWTCSRSIFVPARPSKPGSKVTAATMATTTVTADATPIRPIEGMPAIHSAMSATTTVRPANSTAVPDVALARAAASIGDASSRRYERCRVTTNRA